MAETTINPYKSTIGVQHTNGLSFVEKNLVAGMTIDDLNSTVSKYVQPLYFPGPTTPDQFLTDELLSIIPIAINGYVNGTFTGYNDYQMKFIVTLLDTIVQDVPLPSILASIRDIEDNITRSELNTYEQIPLLIATAVAAADVAYWRSVVTNPQSNWYTKGYFDANAYVNSASISFWVQATIATTLVGANKAVHYGLIDPPRVAGIDLVTALTASIGGAAGKVMFGYIPRVKYIPSAEDFILKKTNLGAAGSDGSEEGIAHKPWKSHILCSNTGLRGQCLSRSCSGIICIGGGAA